MAASCDLATAAASGDLNLVKRLVHDGADVNKKSRDGFTPLCNAAFWGYSHVAEYLIQHGADVNLSNGGTLWTPCHCAAFQGHGKVLMKLLEAKPNLSLQDNRGRTAADFASAMEAIWPFFATEGCKRTSKAELVRLDIVKKVKDYDPTMPSSDYAHFSRPGSAYVMKSQPMRANDNMDYKRRMAEDGDVLSIEEEVQDLSLNNSNPSFNIWRR
ncbi:ankyrin repeat domain-containing protein 49-like [Lytechinus variegatus]|uniref:ankyrin repeat domain-containing protein 49-like n=1 Tax=Lytechinus variegatus TaxID=7654 RepID=UPI001BB29C32|nr:ankyrin repeat domain-containing protein 49-like [Lytechinus variegatus]